MYAVSAQYKFAIQNSLTTALPVCLVIPPAIFTEADLDPKMVVGYSVEAFTSRRQADAEKAARAGEARGSRTQNLAIRLKGTCW